MRSSVTTEADASFDRLFAASTDATSAEAQLEMGTGDMAKNVQSKIIVNKLCSDSVAVPLDRELITEIKLLSAGAVKSGLRGLIDAFQRTTGHEVNAAFATAPAIRKRVSDGETADVLIAPTGVLDDLAKDGIVVAANRIPVGRVGVGVVARDDAPVPDIATVEAFKQSVLRAESLVYNQASTGIYLAGLFDRLGIADHLKAKTRQYPNGAAVLDHVSRGKGCEIGFGAITEIIGHGKPGLRLIGPLPAQIQNYTTYEVTVLAAGAVAVAAQAFVRYLTTPQKQEQRSPPREWNRRAAPCLFDVCQSAPPPLGLLMLMRWPLRGVNYGNKPA